MGYISYVYKKKFVCRYDQEVGVPYHVYTDFPGLKQEAYTFINSSKVEIHYFYYYYDNYRDDKIVLFIHGLGPGHASYLAEINALAKKGYKILTFDATGCGESKGKILKSLNQPTRDVIELLEFLKLDKPIVLVGHSLGGYTSLNVLNLRKDITKAVVMSGFLSIASELGTSIKSSFICKHILKYEKKVEPELYKLDNVEFLKNTKDQIFFIQSDDDQMVPYDIALKVVEGIDNPNIKKLRVTGKKHNPNYSYAAVDYMNEVFGRFNELINKKEIRTDEQRIAYFKDVSLERLVEQDEDIINQICEFIG